MFTIQSNTAVFLWLLLSLILNKNPEQLNRIKGCFRGAVTLYITVTFLVFAILLQGAGYFSYESLVLHYIVPIGFILDWFLTEWENKYEWKYLLVWILYPIIYLVYTMIAGAQSGFYPYFFLDVVKLGWSVFLMWVALLVAIFVLLGMIYIKINHKLVQLLK
jgi:hypothetical protein